MSKTKLTPELIETFETIINDFIYCTDEDLFEELCEKCPELDIKVRTLQAYKRGERQQDNPLIDKFVFLIKKALRKEKMELLKGVKKGEYNWQSKAWILERKFTEWNLKQISESDLNVKGSLVDKIANIKKISFLDDQIQE